MEKVYRNNRDRKRDNREPTDRKHKKNRKRKSKGKERERVMWREVERKGGLREKKRI